MFSYGRARIRGSGFTGGLGIPPGSSPSHSTGEGARGGFHDPRPKGHVKPTSRGGRVTASLGGRGDAVLSLIGTVLVKPLAGVNIGPPARHGDRQPGPGAGTGGADVALCASNPLSTQDAVARPRSIHGIPHLRHQGRGERTYHKHHAVLDRKPHHSGRRADRPRSATRSYPRRPRRHRGDHHRRHAPAQHGQGRQARYSHSRQRLDTSTCSTTGTARANP